MPTTTALPVIITPSMYDTDGRVTCAHRDLSVCKACFQATPGLVEVYGAHYAFDPEYDAAMLADCDATQVFVSPGTVLP